MIKTTLVANTESLSNKETTGIEVGIVNRINNGKHTHEYQVFNLQNPTPNVGLIGVNNEEIFAIQIKFSKDDDFAFAAYLDGVNVSQKSGILSLNDVEENQRDNYKAHKGKFVSRHSETRKVGYIDRYDQKNGENRQFTFTTQANAGINEVLLNDYSLKNRIEVYVWRDVKKVYDSHSYALMPNTIPSQPTKVGAGQATNQEYNNTAGLNNPEFLGKVMFIHTQARNVSHLGKLLVSLEEIEKSKIDDPMNRVPRT